MIELYVLYKRYAYDTAVVYEQHIPKIFHTWYLHNFPQQDRSRLSPPYPRPLSSTKHCCVGTATVDLCPLSKAFARRVLERGATESSTGCDDVMMASVYLLLWEVGNETEWRMGNGVKNTKMFSKKKKKSFFLAAGWNFG